MPGAACDLKLRGLINLPGLKHYCVLQSETDALRPLAALGPADVSFCSQETDPDSSCWSRPGPFVKKIKPFSFQQRSSRDHCTRIPDRAHSGGKVRSLIIQYGLRSHHEMVPLCAVHVSGFAVVELEGSTIQLRGCALSNPRDRSWETTGSWEPHFCALQLPELGDACFSRCSRRREKLIGFQRLSECRKTRTCLDATVIQGEDSRKGQIAGTNRALQLKGRRVVAHGS